MIRHIILLSIVLLVGCTDEEPWSSSDYFIGSWTYTTDSYVCCSSCNVQNAEEECTRIEDTSYAEITFFENGKCVRRWDNTEEQDTFSWCYNANTLILVLKKEDGAFSQLKESFYISDIDNSTFRTEFNPIISLLFRTNSFTRI